MRYYKVRYADEFYRQLDDIRRYISERLNNPLGAERLSKEIFDTCDLLCVFPLANPIRYYGERANFRLIHVGHYTVAFSVNEAERIVVIESVHYSRRDIESLLQ
ncbi:type II toxin-antitoxin system RelE/ParE family toxin [Candidatus Saccharibacteria bacterium]|nr:type II toxin-antitoxin system RelE/ParE family toxin [Candidatus Saccharibacteria bacterium]